MNSQSKKTQNHTLFISFSDLVGGRRGVDYKINIERIGGHGLSSLFFFCLSYFFFQALGRDKSSNKGIFGLSRYHCLSKAGTDVPEMERS